MTARRLVRFESLDGATVVQFGEHGYSWQTDETLRLALSQAARASWAWDHLGTAPAPVDVAVERVVWTLIGATEADLEAQLSAVRAGLLAIGRGWLVRVDSDGTERRAVARAAMMPSFTRAPGSQRMLAIQLEFRRLSHWQATVQTTGSQLISAASVPFTISNPGNLACDAIVFRLRSNSATGGTAPRLDNTTTGWWFASSRTMTSAADEIRVDTGAWLVQWSTNDGASYTADWATFSYGTAQEGIMRLAPGVNQFVATVGSGTPDYTLEWAFYARYA